MSKANKAEVTLADLENARLKERKVIDAELLAARAKRDIAACKREAAKLKMYESKLKKALAQYNFYLPAFKKAKDSLKGRPLAEEVLTAYKWDAPLGMVTRIAKARENHRLGKTK